MKNKTTLELAFRLNEVARQIDKLEMEYNQIIDTLCERIETLKDDVNMQKKKSRKLKYTKGVFKYYENNQTNDN